MRRWLPLLILLTGLATGAPAAPSFKEEFAKLEKQLAAQPTNTALLFEIADLCHDEGCRENKPAVPLAGKYRLIDIPMSNCFHADIEKIAILTQFKSVWLHRHFRRSYALDRFKGGCVEVLGALESLD